MNYKKLLVLVILTASFLAMAIDGVERIINVEKVTTNLLNQNISIVPTGTGSVVLGGNAHTAMPSGTTAQRDVSPPEGSFRYNTTTFSFEGYNDSSWSSLGDTTALVHIELRRTATLIVPTGAQKIDWTVAEDSSDPNTDFNLTTDVFTSPRAAFYKICFGLQWNSTTWTAPITSFYSFEIGATNHYMGGHFIYTTLSSKAVWQEGCTQVYMTAAQTGFFEADHQRGFSTTMNQDSYLTITEIPTTK